MGDLLGNTGAPNGQTAPMDITALFSSLFNTGSNTPQTTPGAPPPPPTDAAGIGQGFQGITQGFEGLNTMPRQDSDDDNPFAMLMGMFS